MRIHNTHEERSKVPKKTTTATLEKKSRFVSNAMLRSRATPKDAKSNDAAQDCCGSQEW